MTVTSDKPPILQHGVSMPLMSRGVMKLTLLALLFALLAVWVVHDRLQARHEANLEDVFLFEGSEITFRIEERLRAYHQVLKGARGLFAASNVVDRAEWRAYTQALDLEEEYSGIQGLGFARYLQPEALESHVLGMRAEGFADYDVWPAGEREAYSAIVMLEPLDWRNSRALGFDMYSEAMRRDAMDRAVATGRGALSGPVTLVQESGQDIQTGVLFYLPVFVTQMPTETADDRQAALSGWVYSPFRMNDLIEAVKRTQGAIRASDIVGRYGGDEFVVLLPRIDSTVDLETVAEKINAALQRPFTISGHEVRISASIGIACYPADGTDIDTLLRHADLAMYRAKSDGRNGSRQFSEVR